MLLCQPGNEEQHQVSIKYLHALRNIELQIDRSNPRILYLVVKDISSKFKDYQLEFQDVNKTTGVKQFLEENRKSIRNTEYLLLDSYIDDLLNKWTY